MPALLTICLRATAALALLMPVLSGGARGQVAVNMHALDGTGATQPTRRSPAPRAPAHSTGSANGGSHANQQPAGSPPGGQPSAASQTAVDNPASKPPAAPALPTQQPAPPPASTTVSGPATSPLPLPQPVRLVFEAGKTDLTPADEAAIQELARAIPTPDADSINVVAYAAGKPDDPSTARRLSLSRGLAVRSVLLASGVPSARIYVRALGSTPSDGPADRVELIVAPIGTVVR